MTYYLTVILFIVLIGQFAKNQYKSVGYFLIFILLVLMFGLRGDFTSDYRNYYYLFKYYQNSEFASIIKVTSAQEIGFIALSKFLSNFMSYQLYLIVIGMVIVGCYMYGFIKECSEPWIPLVLFIGFGGYFSSFNIMRQIMASAIVFAGCKYLYSREMKKYLLYVAIASTFHLTALIMVPMYFFLNMKIDKTFVTRYIVYAFVAFIGLNSIFPFFQSFLTRFNTYTFGGYGMTGGSVGYFGSFVIMSSLALFLYHTISADCLNTDDTKVRIQINALGCVFIVAVLTTKAFLLERFSYYFLPHTFLLISNMLIGSKLQLDKMVIAISIILLTLTYVYMSLNGSAYNPYYFYWETDKMRLFYF